MNDQEKSVMLARAMGWRIEWNKYGLGCVVDRESNPISGVIGELDEDILEQLYSPANMALAWRVLNFGFDLDEACMVTTFTDWYERHAIRIARSTEPQRIFLDKILEFVIEGGFFEVENA